MGPSAGWALGEGSWVGQERGRDEDSSMTSTGLAWQLVAAARGLARDIEDVGRRTV